MSGNHASHQASADRADRRDQTLLSGMITAAELDVMTFPPLIEHVPHLITEGFGILAGSPKIGKSWLAAGVALACADGGAVLGGISVQGRHVLLLALNHDQPLPQRLDIITYVSPGAVTATMTEWLERHRGDTTPPLIILDTLGKARPQRRPGDDPYIADYQVGSLIKMTVDAVPGAALVAVHHTRKMRADDWLDTVSGTQGITGSADYTLLLSRRRKSDDGVLAVTGRDIAENEYAIKFNRGIWSLDGMDILDAAATVTTRNESTRQTRLGAQSLDALEFVNSRSATSPAELAAHLQIDNRMAGNLLARLADSDHIAKPARGTYTPIGSENGESDENAGQVIFSDRSPSDESDETGSGRLPANSVLSSDSSPPHAPPGGLTGETPGLTDRVQQALDHARRNGHKSNAATSKLSKQ
ncbi:AAA family ATPase [Mycobacterium colombiense]|uniref:AAA family ATPase n=1 Tax=Mycobacterium colombiense TaxID=339268 RepID=UPI0009700DEE|nr:AAA family ATPase [Mycobacterium colombiense]OMB93582.1 hypothetical protein A5732_15405 [Mycobacterium colombiense]